MKNNLVLSSHNKSLENDYCNIFLDERTFVELEKKPLNYKFSESVLFSNKERIYSFNECDQIYKSILDDLFLKLNKHHNIKWTRRSWEILIGFWLRKFVYIIYFKFNNLNNILKRKNIDKVCLSKIKNNNLASHESTSIQDLSIDSDWSWILYSKIFEYLDTNKIKVDYFENEKKNFYENQTLFEKLNKNKKKLKHKLLASYNFLTNKLLSENRNFIVGTYLPQIEEKKLELLFGQIPTFYTPPKIEYSFANYNLRQKISLNKNCLIKEKIVRDLLLSYLPTFVLENFQVLKTTVEKHNYPKNPKFIFTSNIFQSDEAFKFYLANMISSNKSIKYFVGQHGNSYFTRIDNNYSNEVLTCDYFISWGNKNKDDKKIINLFNLKLPKNSRKKNTNKIVIVFRSLGYQTVPYDRWKEGKEELLMAKTFIKYFDKNFYKNIHLRLHGSFKHRYKSFVQNYLNDISNFKKDFEEYSYEKVIDDARLVIFTYDATGFLENLVSNKPSISLYPNIYIHLNEDCKKYYKNLKDAKIIFDNPKEMYDHINDIWPNIDDWWNNQKTQNEIKNFLKFFSASPNQSPLRLIKKNIIEKIT